MKRLLLLVFVSPLVSCYVTPSPHLAFPRGQETKSQRLTRLKSVDNDDTSADRLPLLDVDGEARDRTAGLLVLASVPIAWGTYGPVVKFLYEVQPAVPGIVFSAAYYIVASLVLNVLSILSPIAPMSDGFDDDFPVQGGLELGSYLFLGNLLQVKGLETVPSDRAAFIVQLTTIIVPLLSAVINKVSVSLRTWLACILAFTGVIIMGLDGKEVGLSLAASLTEGDFLVMAAAVLYSMHVVRLSRYAMETTPLKLAASKATTEAILSITVVTGLLWTNVGGTEVATFFEALTSGWVAKTVTLTTLTPAIGAILWTGLVTCAYTIYAQSYGQARVAPTEANLIYTIQPLFTSLFAYMLLGETLGIAGVGGGALIALAVYAVANQDPEGPAEPMDDDPQNGEVHLSSASDKSILVERTTTTSSRER